MPTAAGTSPAAGEDELDGFGQLMAAEEVVAAAVRAILLRDSRAKRQAVALSQSQRKRSS